MGRRTGAVAALAAIWLALAGPGAAAASEPASAPASADVGREVLVMLRLPPPHFRPNASYGDGYGDALGRSARLRIARALARDHGLLLVTDWPMPILGVDCFVMAAPAGRSPQDEASSLSRDPAVAWAEPMQIYHAQGAGARAPNDPLFEAQPAARVWRLADLHEMATGRGVRVAVIDSRVEAGHPDLIGQVQISEDFVTGRPGGAERHGTGVAGVIAARADNGLGVAGVAPGARLLALRACWQASGGAASAPATLCDSLSLAKALEFAIGHGAQVINLSLSGPPDILLGRLIDAALERGVTVVGAFDRAQADGGFPASHSGVVAVADEASPPPRAGIYLAPGRDVPTTQPGGKWFLVSGSSYSAAHVSGLIALVRESARGGRRPTLVVVRNGGGAIDACATLLRANGPCDCACSRPVAQAALDRR